MARLGDDELESIIQRDMPGYKVVSRGGGAAAGAPMPEPDEVAPDIDELRAKYLGEQAPAPPRRTARAKPMPRPTRRSSRSGPRARPTRSIQARGPRRSSCPPTRGGSSVARASRQLGALAQPLVAPAVEEQRRAGVVAGVLDAAEEE